MLTNQALQILREYNAVYLENADCYRELARSYGLSECAFWIFYSLRLQPEGVTQSALCDDLHLPKQTVNSALKKLEAEGLVTQQVSADRRRKAVTLTPAGEALCSRTVDKAIALECQAMLAMTEQERLWFFGRIRSMSAMLRGGTE